jgi:superoxide dismutase, Cu-Zn family
VSRSRLSLVLPLCAAVAGCWNPWSPGPYPTPTRVPAAPPPAAPPPSARRTIAPSGARATAVLHDAVVRRVGTVYFSETYAGLLVRGEVSDLGVGPHGIHLHSIGKCEAPFTSAGGHYNPEQRAHGFNNQHGHHLGDLPNIVTPAAGKLDFEFVTPGVVLTGPFGMLDADGASIVVHATADDYLTDPAGNSGARLACGVITPAP